MAKSRTKAELQEALDAQTAELNKLRLEFNKREKQPTGGLPNFPADNGIAPAGLTKFTADTAIAAIPEFNYSEYLSADVNADLPGVTVQQYDSQKASQEAAMRRLELEKGRHQIAKQSMDVLGMRFKAVDQGIQAAIDEAKTVGTHTQYLTQWEGNRQLAIALDVQTHKTQHDVNTAAITKENLDLEYARIQDKTQFVRGKLAEQRGQTQVFLNSIGYELTQS